MKWKKWGKFFADKVLIWLVLAGVCVAGVWSMLDQHHWEQAGWSYCRGGWVAPGHVVEVVPEQLNADGTTARPVQPFSSRPYDWDGGVDPAPNQEDGGVGWPADVPRPLSKKSVE